MKPINFKEANTIIAKDQSEYLPLPAFKDTEGQVVSCWQFSWQEIIKLIFRRKLFISQLTFNSPLQPIALDLDNPITIIGEPK